MTRYKLAFAVAKYIEYGGMQRTMLRIARECARRGHEVGIFVARWQGAMPEDLRVRLLSARAWTNHGLNNRFGARLQQALAGDDFDCVIGSTKVAGLDVYYGGDPCYAARIDENRRGRLYKLLPRYRTLVALEREVFGADKDTEILLIAQQERDKFIRYYGTDPKRFHLLPPGIDRDRLQRDAPTDEGRRRLRSQLGVGEDEYMLLNVGSRFRTKGIDRVIRALAALPASLRARTKFMVIGDDDARPFARLARALDVVERVSFVGAVEDVTAFYHAADLLVHPAYTENTGTTLIEAMLCGLAVLTTANCGFAFHVERAAAGRVCPEPFIQATFNRLLAEMLEHERLQQWGEAGLRYCARTDLYSLIPRAADVIIARATRNRGSR